MPFRHINETKSFATVIATKAAATITNGQVLFTIANGPIYALGILGVCKTANDATASTVQFSLTPVTGATTTISGVSGALTSYAIGSMLEHSFTTLATAPANISAVTATAASRPTSTLAILAPGSITAVVGVGSTTGTWEWYLRYIPINSQVTVS